MRQVYTVLLGFSIMGSVAACETLASLVKDPRQIETVLAAQVAGNYVVTITKDGQPVYSESWVCTKGADGKLSGCHKIMK